jgi:uncharacterized Ntn-hydrolase superfamily protein
MSSRRFWPPDCKQLPVRAVALVLGLAVVAAAVGLGPGRAAATEPVATFSIVGYDPETGDLGVAVQSKFFAVGSVVPFAKAGVGAIASQALGNTSYGPRGLAMLELGVTPEATLETLLSDDADREHRQVGIVDAQGRSAAFTGSECMAWAGDRTGENCSVQGNILVGEETVDAMVRAFQETDDILAERLMRAIEAGQAAGGDSRGMQSAALLVVRAGAGYGGHNDRYCDLRVDDSQDPIRELRRVFQIWKHDALINEGYRLVEKGDFEAAFEVGRRAIAESPGEGEPHYHMACFLARAGDYDAALAELEKARELDGELPSWAAEDPDLEPLYDRPEFQALVGS